MKTFTKSSAIALTTLLSFSLAPAVSAHCQVPCGIYSDNTVLTDLLTHRATIEKAMKQIAELSVDPGKNANQITRWINTKEEHATKIQSTMTQYFLAQRIKLAEAESDKKSHAISDSLNLKESPSFASFLIF